MSESEGRDGGHRDESGASGGAALDYDALLREARRQLAETGYRPRVPEPGWEARVEAGFAERIAAPQTRVESRRRRRWIRAGVVVALAACLAVVLVLIDRPGPTPRPAAAGTPPLLRFPGTPVNLLPERGEDATERFRELAARAQERPEPASEPVQHVALEGWVAARGVEAGSQVKSTLVPDRRDLYFLPDGTVRLIQRLGAPLDKAGRLADEASGPTGEVVSDESFPSPDPGPGYPATLSTDPTVLAEQLLAEEDPATCGGEASGWCLANAVINLHQQYVVPPDLDAALWQVLADEPSITYLGEATGRFGDKVDVFMTRYLDPTSQQLLLVDPETGGYRGQEIVLTEPSETYGFDPPAVTSFTMLLDAERIPETELPDAPASP